MSDTSSLSTSTRHLAALSRQLQALPCTRTFQNFVMTPDFLTRLLEKHREHTVQRIRRLHTLFMEHSADMDKRDTLASYTWDVQKAIDVCRQSCGGNGHIKYMGLAELFVNFSVMVTFEDHGTSDIKLPDARCGKLRRDEKLAGSVQYVAREQASNGRRQ
ncbi:unnamed protein product [Peronospora destructor]|uniref:Acyl-CoA oxidase C-alpha1 domain-containing protein n=1 Tax=Peronospora destructor TaxID=86335 RepID=A0AAV0VKS7_9STRA|nr:unnamed protein product [Peronospora destructor]